MLTISAMKRALALLLPFLAAASPAPAAKTPVVRMASPPERTDLPPRRLDSAAELERLCAELEPAERLRANGDAVSKGEAERRHELARDRAITARYEVVVAAGKVAFAPYDAAEERLALADPSQLAIAGGVARLWPTEEPGLPVDVDPAAARRILQAQRVGRLELRLVFDLPDDAVCGATQRAKRYTLAVEPVAWRWQDGESVLARGGAGADRPLYSAAQGGRPRIDVGAPLTGAADARRLVLAHAYDLEACYAQALKRDPSLDGVIVAELGSTTPAIAADSVGDDVLASCVRSVLRGTASGERAAVPIRFVLDPPASPASQGTGSGQGRQGRQ